jgi:fatty-acid desaturase
MFKWLSSHISWDKRILALQMICHVMGIYTLIAYFNVWYLLAALLLSNILVNSGIGLCYHRMYAHKSWKAHPIVENILHFFGVITCMGPAINWVGTHRVHHMTADTPNDPHSPVGKPLLTKIMYWFNFWEKHHVSVNHVKDLIRKPNQKFFFRNYFKIIFAWVLFLYLLTGTLGVMYFFFVTTMFSIHSVSWITVGAHIFGKQEHTVNDYSLNTNIMGIYLWGEGYHNNHHWKPYSPDFGQGKFDLGYQIIKLIGTPR